MSEIANNFWLQLVCIGLGLGVCQFAHAQTASTTPAQAWYDYYQQRASSDYELVWSDAELPLTLKRQEILNWTNPLEDGQINGSTFVWENAGRPIVVGQFFSYLIGDEKRRFCHVFSTLSDDKLVAKRHGAVFWQPKVSNESGWHVVTSAAQVVTNCEKQIV